MSVASEVARYRKRFGVDMARIEIAGDKAWLHQRATVPETASFRTPLTRLVEWRYGVAVCRAVADYLAAERAVAHVAGSVPPEPRGTGRQPLLKPSRSSDMVYGFDPAKLDCYRDWREVVSARIETANSAAWLCQVLADEREARFRLVHLDQFELAIALLERLEARRTPLTPIAHAVLA